MRTPVPLPASLGSRFTVSQGLDAGVSRSRLHRADLEIPFRGVRAKITPAQLEEDMDPYQRQAAERRIRAREYAPRLRPGQFLSHETAVALRGGPLPLTTRDGRPVDGRALPVHVSTLGSGPLVRAQGVRGHRADPRSARAVATQGLVLASPATTFAQLGRWSLLDLVALGDFLCRVWRPGAGRRDAGRPPFTTIDALRATLSSTRWRGITRLREALELTREDSWSPRESALRVHIVLAGLPEPLLNHDVYDDHGRFLGCVDLAYPHLKVAIEYQGVLHHSRYSADVERIALLRAAGWTVIEVTSALLSQPEELIERVSRALRR
ncbi:DUF559 domain-containing protein [Microbacterium sp. NPDC058342]|uniref:DUF559 domain-containing protein n=1 Tax=Microbacterium sp. NPDC058342 TaxID=3346454 RepID=UPI0036618504